MYRDMRQGKTFRIWSRRDESNTWWKMFETWDRHCRDTGVRHETSQNNL